MRQLYRAVQLSVKASAAARWTMYIYIRGPHEESLRRSLDALSAEDYFQQIANRRARNATTQLLAAGAQRVAVAMLSLVFCWACESRHQKTQPLAVGKASSSTEKSQQEAPCPKEMVAIEEFCVDRYEAHLVEWTSGRRHKPFFRPQAKQRYRASSAPRVLPQAYIDRDEASRACSAAGKRLCRAAEWRRACVGSKSLRFGYGNRWVQGRCNTHKGHALAVIFGKNTPFSYEAHYNNPKVNQHPNFLAKTGKFSQCRSSDGVYDLVGNLHEWVADQVSTALKRSVPIPYGDHKLGPKGNAVFMGGYFSSKGEHGRGCNYITTNHASDYHDYSIGFRCCRDKRH